MNQDFTILIADDIPSNRLVLRKLLEREGFSVVEAENGAQSLSQIYTGLIDIALLDVMMPEMDGFEVCRRIRARFSQSELPVLFITAKTEDADLEQGFNAGGNDYITKPISSTVLRARLSSQIRMLSASRALTRSYEQISKKRRMETVGVFAASIAHNFNNILGTVLGSSELIELCTEEEDVKSASRLIAAAARRGAALIDNLLTFCHPGKEDYCSNPGDILRSTVSLLPSFRNSEIKIQLDILNEPPPLALSPDALAQIFIELLKNSAEAIQEKGEIHIRADTLWDGELNSQAASFIVSDTGRGIPKHIQEHLFEPFFSTKNLDERMGIALDGSGLGLSTIYNLTEQAKGKISLLETNSGGTTFELILPTA
jgi:signal transduction histidine kinase